MSLDKEQAAAMPLCPLLMFISRVQPFQFGYFSYKKNTCIIMLWKFMWGWSNTVQWQKCNVSSAFFRYLSLSLGIVSFLDCLSSTRRHRALG